MKMLLLLLSSTSVLLSLTQGSNCTSNGWKSEALRAQAQREWGYMKDYWSCDEDPAYQALISSADEMWLVADKDRLPNGTLPDTWATQKCAEHFQATTGIAQLNQSFISSLKANAIDLDSGLFALCENSAWNNEFESTGVCHQSKSVCGRPTNAECLVCYGSSPPLDCDHIFDSIETRDRILSCANSVNTNRLPIGATLCMYDTFYICHQQSGLQPVINKYGTYFTASNVIVTSAGGMTLPMTLRPVSATPRRRRLLQANPPTATGFTATVYFVDEGSYGSTQTPDLPHDSNGKYAQDYVKFEFRTYNSDESVAILVTVCVGGICIPENGFSTRRLLVRNSNPNEYWDTASLELIKNNELKVESIHFNDDNGDIVLNLEGVAYPFTFEGVWVANDAKFSLIWDGATTKVEIENQNLV